MPEWFIFILFLGIVCSIFLGIQWARDHSGKTLGALFGLTFAGPLGAIAGVYFGAAIDLYRDGEVPVDDKAIFEINLIAILSYVAKADGKIHQKEFEVIFENYGFDICETEHLSETFASALRQDVDLEEICVNFKRASKYEERLMLLRMVYLVAASDREIHPNEQIAIDHIIEYLEVATEDYASLRGLLQTTEEKYYDLLGVNSTIPRPSGRGFPPEGSARETMGFSNSGFHIDNPPFKAGRFIVDATK